MAMAISRILRMSGKTSRVIWLWFTFIRFKNKLVDNYGRFPRILNKLIVLFNEPFICFTRLLGIPTAFAENAQRNILFEKKRKNKFLPHRGSCGTLGKYVELHLFVVLVFPTLYVSWSCINQTSDEQFHGTHFLLWKECAKGIRVGKILLFEKHSRSPALSLTPINLFRDFYFA